MAQPAYRNLLETGELRRRAERARADLAACTTCPRACGVDRLADEPGVCGIGRHAVVSSAFAHHGEEDCLRGWRGSGTVFFAGCNLKCVFCQNWDTSHEGVGRTLDAPALASLMLELQDAGCHNVNLVTPEHVVPQVLEALAIAAEGGLSVPLVYNTSAYDALESLALLDGVVDVYMPDFKLWDPDACHLLLKARDYPEQARAALREMHRQVGTLEIDAQGLARRGVLVRHLLMPGHAADTEAILGWLAAELGPGTYVNVMGQYHPDGLVAQRPERWLDLQQRVSQAEQRKARALAASLGLRVDGRVGAAG